MAEFIKSNLRRKKYRVVVSTDGLSEDILATKVVVTPSGSLVFWDLPPDLGRQALGHLEVVKGYATGVWLSFSKLRDVP